MRKDEVLKSKIGFEKKDPKSPFSSMVSPYLYERVKPFVFLFDRHDDFISHHCF